MLRPEPDPKPFDSSLVAPNQTGSSVPGTSNQGTSNQGSDCPDGDQDLGTLSSVQRIEVVNWAELHHEDFQRIEILRQLHHSYRTPFFSPAFFDAVSRARGDSLVAVLHDENDHVAGYFPFQRSGRSALPVGRHMNDAHNVLLPISVQLDWKQLLKRCGVNSYDFHSLVGRPVPGRQTTLFETIESFAAECGDDSRAFVKKLEREHKTIKKQEQKTRKMEREIGPLRFEMECRDPDLLWKAINWKRDQYRRTHILDLFLPEWTRGILQNLFEPSEHQFDCRALVSVLWAGDEPAAIHVGMIEKDILHYWFPTYNVDLSLYSPGTALFKSIVGAASEHGVRTVDMGYGVQPYKRKQTDTITKVRAGRLSASPVRRLAGLAQHRSIRWAKQIPMKEQLKKVVRAVKPNAGVSRIR